MIFLTRWFWLFFMICAAVHAALPTPQGKRWWILAASLFFQYHFAGWSGMLPIVGLVLTTYYAARRYRETPSRALLLAAVAINVATLIAYKYVNFLAFSVARLPTFVGHAAWVWHPVALKPPIGISFFVFEFVHYLVEVSHGMPSATSLKRFWVFASFFPSMVSGPIKRFPDFDPQLDGGGSVRIDGLASGLSRVIVGCFKKVVLAEPCYAYATYFVAHPAEQPLVLLLLALSFQIYFDFAGYSDMAIGIGECLGYRLPENFRNPYGAWNMSEFWKRWHMSLSSWIRDYIYIPLGGNRVSRTRRVLNASVAMLLCGFWHGPAMHFGLWGLWHGLLLSISGAWQKRRAQDQPPETLWMRYGKRCAGTALTFVAVAFGWLLFFYDLPTLTHLLRESKGLF